MSSAADVVLSIKLYIVFCIHNGIGGDSYLKCFKGIHPAARHDSCKYKKHLAKS